MTKRHHCTGKRPLKFRATVALTWLVFSLGACGGGDGGQISDPATQPEPYQQVAVANTGSDEVPFIAVHEDGSTVALLGEDGLISGVVYESSSGDSLQIRIGVDGLPNVAVVPGYLFVFSNYTDSAVDLGVIDLSTDRTTIHRGVELGGLAQVALERQRARIQGGDTLLLDSSVRSLQSDPEAFELLELWELGSSLADLVILVGCIKAGALTSGVALLGPQGAVCASSLINVLVDLTEAANPELENTLAFIGLHSEGLACTTSKECVDLIVDFVQLAEEATDGVIEAADPERVFTERRLGSLLASSEGEPSHLYLVEVSPDGADYHLGSMSIPNEPSFPMTDIAICPSGEVFGISYTTLYRIDVGRTQVNVVLITEFDHVIPSPFPDNAVALECQGQRLLVGAGQTLYEIDPETATVTEVGFHDLRDYAGDLATGPDGTLYATVRGSGTNSLIQIDSATGNAVLVGEVGYDEIFGLGFIGDRLFGLTDASFTTDGRLIEISLTTGTGAEVRRLGFPASGASPVLAPDSSSHSEAKSEAERD